jgi:hypothetical protein
MTRQAWFLLLAVLCVVLGAAFVVAGVWLWLGLPAALVVAGAGLLALGLVVIPT